MPQLHATYTFRLEAANPCKHHALHAQLQLRQQASDFTLDRLKLLCVMLQLPVYDARKQIYSEIRLQFPKLGSKAAQLVVKDVYTSTLATDCAKLLATTKIDATIVLDNQMFDIHESNDGFRRLWIQFPDDSRASAGRYTRLRIPLSGKYPTESVLSKNVEPVDQIRIVRRLRKDVSTLFANITCTIAVPDTLPVDSAQQILGLDQNINRICGSDGRHWKLTDYRHQKAQLYSAMRKSDGPVKLRGNPKWRNKSLDYWRKLASRIASYAANHGFRAVSVEDLAGIRKSSIAKYGKGRKFNWKLHNGFPFRMFQGFLKSALAKRGIRLLPVKPAYTSQTCSACGQRLKGSRRSQARVACKDPDCGHVQHADTNAATNIRTVATTGWKLVLAPFQAPDVGPWIPTANDAKCCAGPKILGLS